jgi:cephalosporin hydroxylase
MSNISYPSVVTDDHEWSLHWQMSNADRLAISGVLARIQPKTSIEVGCYKGGSLQVITHYSDKVYSLDIDPDVKQLSSKFKQVDFRIGPSFETLPRLVSELNDKLESVDFVLIDGDHSADGVCADINALMNLNIDSRMVILMHDPFNPDCRRGIRTADWEKNPYVHYVELDFTTGNFHPIAHDTASAGSMWGGLACAILEPWKRTGDLVIGQRQQAVFDAVFPHSCYAQSASFDPGRIVARMKTRSKKILNSILH